MRAESVNQVLPGLKQAGIDFVASLPSQGIARLVGSIADDEAFMHVPVAHEGDAIGLCAGAYLVGRKPAVLMQNCGLMTATYALLDTLYWFGGFPILLVLDHRGSFGDVGGFIFHGYGIQVPRLPGFVRNPLRARGGPRARHSRDRARSTEVRCRLRTARRAVLLSGEPS